MPELMQSTKRLVWQNLLLAILIASFSFSPGHAADLYDLRVFPCPASLTVDFAGVVSVAGPWEKATGKRARISGLLRSWLASSTLRVETDEASCSVSVVDGEFTGSLKNSSMGSFSLRIFHEDKFLYQEQFCFPASFGMLVVSDIDDTILVTDVTSKARMVVNSLFKDVEQRQPVNGTPEFYKSMRHGILKAGTPHFIYLSSSPAFLSRTLKTFLKLHEFPQGTLILKKSLTDGSHQNHKAGWLDHIASRYPDKPLILFGDSGEKDPAIYTDFAESIENPRRIMAVIIHDIADEPDSATHLTEYAERLQKLGVPFISWKDINVLQQNLINLSILTETRPSE